MLPIRIPLSGAARPLRRSLLFRDRRDLRSLPSAVAASSGNGSTSWTGPPGQGGSAGPEGSRMCGESPLHGWPASGHSADALARATFPPGGRPGHPGPRSARWPAGSLAQSARRRVLPMVTPPSALRCLASDAGRAPRGRGCCHAPRHRRHRVACRGRWHPRWRSRSAARVPWPYVSSPRSREPGGPHFAAPGSPVESCGSRTGFPVTTSGRVSRALAPGARTLEPAGRCVVRPVDALATATARVVPFACACDDIRHSCSSSG